jgi:uncharacterized membrane protein
VGEFVERGRYATRIETFVDAAFAFALTMLIISVDDIPKTYADLITALKGIPAFAASFAIIINFWLGHYRWSRRFGLEDTPSLVLSLALVFIVLVFLYPLKIMMAGAFHSMSNGYFPAATNFQSYSDVVDLIVLYGVGFAAMNFVLFLLNWHALRVTLSPPLDAIETTFARLELKIWYFFLIVGLLSGLMTLLPRPYSYFAPWLYASAAIVPPLLSSMASRQAAKLAARVPVAAISS